MGNTEPGQPVRTEQEQQALAYVRNRRRNNAIRQLRITNRGKSDTELGEGYDQRLLKRHIDETPAQKYERETKDLATYYAERRDNATRTWKKTHKELATPERIRQHKENYQRKKPPPGAFVPWLPSVSQTDPGRGHQELAAPAASQQRAPSPFSSSTYHPQYGPQGPANQPQWMQRVSADQPQWLDELSANPQWTQGPTSMPQWLDEFSASSGDGPQGSASMSERSRIVERRADVEAERRQVHDGHRKQQQTKDYGLGG